MALKIFVPELYLLKGDHLTSIRVYQQNDEEKKKGKKAQEEHGFSPFSDPQSDTKVHFVG